MKGHRMKKIYLVRHASPEWGRTDIPYDLPPGPPLSLHGEREARRLAEFLKEQGVAKLYTSPFERSVATAKIISQLSPVPYVEDVRLTEWRPEDETSGRAGERMADLFAEASVESIETGPIALVSHGGPIMFLLQRLGLADDVLSEYRGRFDHSNPLPPAGVWEAAWDDRREVWNLNLKFIPTAAG